MRLYDRLSTVAGLRAGTTLRGIEPPTVGLRATAPDHSITCPFTYMCIYALIFQMALFRSWPGKQYEMCNQADMEFSIDVNNVGILMQNGNGFSCIG